MYLHPSDSIEQQNSDLRQWLVWYNYHKIHLGLGMDKKTHSGGLGSQYFRIPLCKPNAAT